MHHIHNKDEQTRYICLATVNKVRKSLDWVSKSNDYFILFVRMYYYYAGFPCNLVCGTTKGQQILDFTNTNWRRDSSWSGGILFAPYTSSIIFFSFWIKENTIYHACFKM